MNDPCRQWNVVATEAVGGPEAVGTFVMEQDDWQMRRQERDLAKNLKIRLAEAHDPTHHDGIGADPLRMAAVYGCRASSAAASARIEPR